MNVIRCDPQIIQIAVRRADRDGFVSTLKHMATPQPQPVPALTDTPEQQYHRCRQICFRSFHQQVKMVVHQDPRVNPPTVASAHFSQAKQKSCPVLVILKNHHSAILAGHQVVN